MGKEEERREGGGREGGREEGEREGGGREGGRRERGREGGGYIQVLLSTGSWSC